MTTRFATNKISITKNLFEKRKDFNIINTNPSELSFERSMYLFQNPEYLPLLPKREKLVELSGDTTILKVTADSYNNFIRFISRKTFAQKIDFPFISLGNPPTFNTRNPTIYYEEKLTNYYNAFIGYLNINPRIRINNFREFYSVFTNFIYDSISISPFTLYSTVFKLPSYYQNTGLVIYLKSKNLDNDNMIYDEMVKNKHILRMFIKQAAKFGFEVDHDIPFRMIFNPKKALNREKMVGFYEENFLNYYDVENMHLEEIFTTYYDLFTQSKEKNYSPIDTCKIRIRTKATVIDKGSVVTMEDKLGFYLNCLLLERKIDDTYERQQILRVALGIAKSLDIVAAMQYIMGQVNRLANTRVTIVPNTGF